MSAASLSAFLLRSGPAVLIEIAETKGSAPRESGTFMLVSETDQWATIGGGQFEYMAIEHARAMLAGKDLANRLDIPLGPEIGQCCGGRSVLDFTAVTPELAETLKARLKAEEEKQPAVFIFGAGHVGKALASALSPLPLSVTVIETRAAELAGLPATVATRYEAMPEALVADIPAGGAAVIVTHDHALDFMIAQQALARDDLAYAGMIGSATKRATFTHWYLRDGGNRSALDRLALPIGGALVRDKRPEVIAALVAAELLCAFACSRTLSDAEAKAAHPADQDRP